MHLHSFVATLPCREELTSSLSSAPSQPVYRATDCCQSAANSSRGQDSRSEWWDLNFCYRPSTSDAWCRLSCQFSLQIEGDGFHEAPHKRQRDGDLWIRALMPPTLQPWLTLDPGSWRRQYWFPGSIWCYRWYQTDLGSHGGPAHSSTSRGSWQSSSSTSSTSFVTDNIPPNTIIWPL